jgi:hypothetical protein
MGSMSMPHTVSPAHQQDDLTMVPFGADFPEIRTACAICATPTNIGAPEDADEYAEEFVAELSKAAISRAHPERRRRRAADPAAASFPIRDRLQRGRPSRRCTWERCCGTVAASRSAATFRASPMDRSASRPRRDRADHRLGHHQIKIHAKSRATAAVNGQKV